jgi:hypothetical protein
LKDVCQPAGEASIKTYEYSSGESQQMQDWKTRLRPWFCAGLSGCAIGTALLAFATGFHLTDIPWEELAIVAAVFVLPCVANSLLGVCVSKKLARRETLLLLASLWLIPSFFAPVIVSFGMFLLPAMVVWTCGFVGISVATKCDADLIQPSENRPSAASE